MENEINQGMGQPMNQQPGQEIPPQSNQQQGQQIPPYRPADPGMYHYPPPYRHHHAFFTKKLNVSLWKCVLAGVIVVILAFGFGIHVGRDSGMGRMRRMAPFMMQMPNNGQGGFYNNYGGKRGSIQIPNGNAQNPNGGFQIPNGSAQNPKGGFQMPNGNGGSSSGQNGNGSFWGN